MLLSLFAETDNSQCSARPVRCASALPQAGPSTLPYMSQFPRHFVTTTLRSYPRKSAEVSNASGSSDIVTTSETRSLAVPETEIESPDMIQFVEEEQARQEIIKSAHEQLDEAFSQRAGGCHRKTLVAHGRRRSL